MYKVTRTTEMGKIFDAFASNNGVSSCSLRFFIDGVRIGRDQTPADLDLEDEDTIDVFKEQTGSDIRLKENVVRVGTSPSGLPLYTWRYIADPTSTTYHGKSPLFAARAQTVANAARPALPEEALAPRSSLGASRSCAQALWRRT